MGWKKLFVGEKMPDKDDPKYKQRYENEVNAGRKFARMMKLDVLAGTVQNFANNHRKLFLVIVFGLIILCLCLNIYRMAFVFNRQQSVQSATERQELILRKYYNKGNQKSNRLHEELSTVNDESNNNNVNIKNDGRTEEH